MGPQNSSIRQETKTEDAKLRTLSMVLLGVVAMVHQAQLQQGSRAEGKAKSRKPGQSSQSGPGTRRSPGKRCLLWREPGLRIGSEGRAPEPGAWQAIFHSPAINSIVIILAAAITPH